MEEEMIERQDINVVIDRVIVADVNDLINQTSPSDHVAKVLVEVELSETAIPRTSQYRPVEQGADLFRHFQDIPNDITNEILTDVHQSIDTYQIDFYRDIDQIVNEIFQLNPIRHADIYGNLIRGYIYRLISNNLTYLILVNQDNEICILVDHHGNRDLLNSPRRINHRNVTETTTEAHSRIFNQVIQVRNRDTGQITDQVDFDERNIFHQRAHMEPQGYDEENGPVNIDLFIYQVHTNVWELSSRDPNRFPAIGFDPVHPIPDGAIGYIQGILCVVQAVLGN